MSNYILIFEQGLRADTQFPIVAEKTTLGRSSQCDIAIADPALSRIHCSFELKGVELWLKDHQSANGTLVNHQTITEQRINPGDTIMAGDSVIRVTLPASTPITPSEPVVSELPPVTLSSDVVIDLGFDTPDTATPTLHQKNIIRPILWGVTAVLIFVTCLWFIFTLDTGKTATKKTTTVDEQDNALLVYYEKVDASPSNIFRYELSLTANGMLAVKIDDLAGGNRHIHKEKEVDPDILQALARDVMESGFFALDKEYTGLPSTPNGLNEHYMVIAIGKKVHSSHLINRLDEPEAFKAIREKLETFSKNELGIWAIQFSTEKLIELAQNALDVAKKQYAERGVKLGNRYDAIRNYQEAIFYLDTVNPKPDFYEQIQEELEIAKADLKQQLQEQNFRADRAINLADWPTAARELKIICELIPDRTDEVHKTAARKLLDVETRIKKR
jgi:pSer/pThr/pTyr-binding forkhead associated (FHA) protein